MQSLIRFFTWPTSKEYLKENPAISLKGESGLTKAEKIAAKQIAGDEDEEGRSPFTSEQLKSIFSQLHNNAGHGNHVKKPGYWYGFEYWLPLLGLYGGLRIKEASQLHLADVREVDEVWYLDINRRTADKSLKNDQSVRIVPIHPELICLVFLRYCDSMRLARYPRVFPELTWSKGNAKYAKESGRKMSDMLKKLGMLMDGTLVYHCLRHNVNNELMRVPVSAIPKADEHLKKYIRLQ
jgi:integrase